MKICYFGEYNRDYPRNSILRKGLRQNGIDVIECDIPFLTKYSHQYPKLLKKYFSLHSKFDAIIVAEMNQFTVPLAKALSKINGIPLIFDMFFSLYDSTVNDRKVLSGGAPKAVFLKFLDKLGLILPNIVLTDTEAHSRFYHDTFGISYSKMMVVRVGSDPDIFYPYDSKDTNNKDFTVSFVGTFIPLHGVKYIIKAAKLVEKDRSIKFEIVGEGQTYIQDYKLAKEMNCNNIRFLEPVPLRELPFIIDRADICLGIFGDTAKARRVIPNKIYQALAMKKPVITGDSPAIKEIFGDGEHLILCSMANPRELAVAIIMLKQNRPLMDRISDRGYQLVRTSFAPKAIAKSLKDIIEELGK